MRTRARLRLAAATGLLSLIAFAPLAAQQGPDSARTARDTVGADTAAALLGPRAPARWRTVQPPRLAASAAAPTPAPESEHTFRFTTLELVLIGVIILLLLVH